MTPAQAPTLQRRGGRLAVVTAVSGTVLIALGAFWLSFTALADLARRSGIDANQACAWPLIVDGIIVVATVSVVALAGQRGAWYPWMLLAAGAIVSVTANALHAIVAADTDVPGVLAASVAAVPPLVLLAITHLTVILTRPLPRTDDDGAAAEYSREPDIGIAARDTLTATTTRELTTPEPAQTIPKPEPVDSDRREVAAELRTRGWSNKAIASRVGVHPSTVGRWFAAPTSLVSSHESQEARP